MPPVKPPVDVICLALPRAKKKKIDTDTTDSSLSSHHSIQTDPFPKTSNCWQQVMDSRNTGLEGSRVESKDAAVEKVLFLAVGHLERCGNDSTQLTERIQHVIVPVLGLEEGSRPSRSNENS